MREVPDCLKRRYEAVDELVKDLHSVLSNHSYDEYSDENITNDRGLKMMCKFWNILKEDPECNLQDAVKETMDDNFTFGANVTCYQMGEDDAPKPRITCGKPTCPKTKDPNSTAFNTTCCKGHTDKDRTTGISIQSAGSTVSSQEPLTQTLDNMKEAAKMEKSCFEKTADLLSIQERLRDQLNQMEKREANEMKLLKEADNMWVAMEDQYKEKLKASKIRQEELIKQLNAVEQSVGKWRKNSKALEQQTLKINKCLREIGELTNQKTNELKSMEAEISDLEKRIQNNSNEVASESKILQAKKDAFNKRIEKMKAESKKIMQKKEREEKLKNDKIAAGNSYIQEARQELAKICRVLLKKRLENEDLRAEWKALVEELDLLQKTCDQCGEKCKNKEQSLKADIEKCQTDIQKFKLRCTKCNVSTDTVYLRRHCSECPRCLEEMDPCVYADDKCLEPAKNECVCISVKKKFMNNVFDNMYTVLERQINTKAGKAVAQQVLSCLRTSMNGKLDAATKKKLQDFILAVVKQNLNLTIIGGAIKTRCEMDPEMYKNLMQCLKLVAVQKPPTVEKGIDSRKAPCARWGGPLECNCPKGPKDCICRRKAPKAVSDPEPNEQLDEDKQDIGKPSTCPHKDQKPCGPLCSNVPEADAKVAQELATNWKPDPCSGKKCQYKNTMRAARCILGNELSERQTFGSKKPMTQNTSLIFDFNEKQDVNSCGSPECTNFGSFLRSRTDMIEDVMGGAYLRPTGTVNFSSSSSAGSRE